MTKKEVLEAITTLAKSHEITKEDLLLAFNEGSTAKESAILKKHVTVSEILYYLGGFIVFLGISILVFQHWNTLSPFAKIMATFISGIVAYCLGVYIGRDEKLEGISHAFHLIGALVMPIGLYVILNLRGYEIQSFGTQTVISVLLFFMYLASFFIFRKTIFLFFSIIFATWTFFSLTSFIIGGAPIGDALKLTEYRFLLIGISYMLLGYYFSQTVHEGLRGFLNGFGTLFFLGASLALGGWAPNQNALWELFFPLLVFGIIFLSVYLKSSAYLTFGILFLMGYILKISVEYFTNSLGWPLVLVLCGFTSIAIGYLGFSLKKKYFLQPIE